MINYKSVHNTDHNHNEQKCQLQLQLNDIIKPLSYQQTYRTTAHKNAISLAAYLGIYWQFCGHRRVELS